MNSVFISYKSEDLSYALKICQCLDRAQVEYWIDAKGIGIGEEYDKIIPEAIPKYDVVLVLVSKGSLESDNVANEIRIAKAFNKKIIPFMLENTKLQGPLLYHVLSNNRIEAYKNWDAAISKLIIHLNGNLNDAKTTEQRIPYTESSKTEIQASCPKCGSKDCWAYDTTDEMLSIYNGVSSIFQCLFTFTGIIWIITVIVYCLLANNKIYESVHSLLVEKLALFQTLPPFTILRKHFRLMLWISFAVGLLADVVFEACDRQSQKIYRREIEKDSRQIEYTCRDCGEKYLIEVNPRLLLKRDNAKDLSKVIGGLLVIVVIFVFFYISGILKFFANMYARIFLIFAIIAVFTFIQALKKSGNYKKAIKQTLDEIKQLFR